MIYRVEISRSAFEGDQEQQFVQAARKSGYNVSLIRNNWALAVTNLTEEQAVSIRDGLERMCIHASIGIESLTLIEEKK